MTARSLPARVLAAMVLAHGSLACTTISVGRYQNAAPLGKGATQITVGMNLPKDGGHGIDRASQTGDPVTQHHGPGLVNQIDVNYQAGLTDRLEASLQAYLWGGKVGGRYTWLDHQRFKASIGGYVGGSWGTYLHEEEGAAPSGGTLRTEGTVGVDYYDFPATFSVHFNDRTALFFGAAATRVNAVGSLQDADLDANQTSEKYQRRVRLWEWGPFLGMTFGDKFQFTPGIQFYREPTRHPVNARVREKWFAYPFLGISFIQKPRLPAPPRDPGPQHEPVPPPSTPPDASLPESDQPPDPPPAPDQPPDLPPEPPSDPDQPPDLPPEPQPGPDQPPDLPPEATPVGSPEPPPD